MRWSAVTLVLTLAVATATTHVGSAAPETGPTIDDLISLKRAGSSVISPDGRLVAYTLRETNWDDNAYKSEIWLADVRTGTTRQLTHSPKTSNAPAWSPDGRRLAFGSDRTDKRQIYLIDPGGGEAERLTTNTEGVGSFAWSPDGASIAFTASDPPPETLKERETQFGQFDVVNQDYRMTHLYVIAVASKQVRQLTKGAFTVGAFDWSPTASRSPLTTGSTGPKRMAAPRTSRSSRSRTALCAPSSRRMGRTRTPYGLLTDRTSRSKARWPIRPSTTRTKSSRPFPPRAAPSKT
jgi:dipeptidyl aminopeptidase/acylaminoacyl peptidase